MVVPSKRGPAGASPTGSPDWQLPQDAKLRSSGVVVVVFRFQSDMRACLKKCLASLQTKWWELMKLETREETRCPYRCRLGFIVEDFFPIFIIRSLRFIKKIAWIHWIGRPYKSRWRPIKLSQSWSDLLGHESFDPDFSRLFFGRLWNTVILCMTMENPS